MFYMNIIVYVQEYDTTLKAWNQRALCWETKEELPEDLKVPKSLSYLQPDAELFEEVTTTFVDAGRYRGVIVGHRRDASLEVTLPEGIDKPTLEDDFQAAVKCIKLCVEWDPPPVPVPRWRVLPNMEDNTIKRRKWYHGFTFFKEHPLAVRSYLSSVAAREVKIEKELEEEEKRQQAKDALTKRAALIGAHKRKTQLELGSEAPAEEAGSVVVLGPVTRSDARCYPPLPQVSKDMLVLRKAEERPFLDDWQ